jgi:signal transduction histidine kinase
MTSQQRQGLQIIDQCSDHLATLIRDMRDFSQPEAHRLAIEPTNFCLETLILSVQDICRVQAQHKEIALHLQVLNQLPQQVYGDEKRLRQVLLNLLWHAIQVTQQGEVWLKVGRMLVNERFADPDASEWTIAHHPSTVYTVRFQVEDTGVGMTAEQVEQTFLPIESGTGLATCRTWIERMGGQMQVKSQPGHGSTVWFSLELPAAVEKAPAN